MLSDVASGMLLQNILTRIVSIAEAAAMAVTAPNYVLEESLSSQRLWKYTAGQRPPQPMEERAFFEKMWAQNFARSQVEYQMPVEVLTATTPISLNPFADINFVTEHNELSHYNLEEATERAHQHNNNKKANPSDVAEAALMRKLHEPPRVAPLVDDGGSHLHSTVDKNSLQQKQQAQQQQVVKNDGGDTLTVLVKGDNVFGTTVSKSFARPSENGGPIKGVDTVNISVASYRVVEVRAVLLFTHFCQIAFLTLTMLVWSPSAIHSNNHSPKNMENMLNSLSFTEKVVFVIHWAYGNDILTSMNFPERLRKLMKDVRP